MSHLVINLIRFGRLLHGLGLPVHVGRMIGAATALQRVDIRRRSDFYFTLRTLLVSRQQDLALFDAAFRAFWRQPRDPRAATTARAISHLRPFGPPKHDPPSFGIARDNTEAPADTATIERIVPLSYSTTDVSYTKDFAEFTDDELARARTIVATLGWELGVRRTKRWRPARTRYIDPRRLVRRSLTIGGELVALPTRERIERPRPLVLICDVSGSMERYARLLIHFAHGMARGVEQLEAFVFATRLTRVTRELRTRSARMTLETVPRLVPDWAGGTRIGEALHTFNARWARRVLNHGPVVLLISDGWDLGEPDRLAQEIARLRRSCRRLIWLNPLLGAPGYQPLDPGHAGRASVRG